MNLLTTTLRNSVLASWLVLSLRILALPLNRVSPPLKAADFFARKRAPSRLMTENIPTVTGYGTHFAYIWVGTPPQRQSVIIDTGSYHTAFPCEPCSNCGDYLDYHESGPFQKSQSSTFSETDNTWTASYGEGDGWHGKVCHDENAFLGGSELVEIPESDTYQLGSNFKFGCMCKLLLSSVVVIIYI